MEAQSTTPRLKEVGTWTEQISSSGKRYYYNSANNVSQWDKPAEWKQAEKMRSSTSSSTPTTAKNGSGRTPIDKASPTSSIAQKVHTHSQSSHRQPPTSSSSSNFAHHQRLSNTAHSSNQQQLKTDIAINKLSSNSLARNSSESPGLIATKRQKLNEDGIVKITNNSSFGSAKKPVGVATHQQQTSNNITSSDMETVAASTPHQNEIYHQKMDERGDHRSTNSNTFGVSHHFQQPMNSPTALNKRPFHSTSSTASVTDRNSINVNRDHQNHPLKAPTKFSSTSPFYSSSDQKGGGKHYQQPHQQSPLLAGTPKPRPLNSINTSAMALTALKDQQQQRHQQFTMGNSAASNGIPTTITSTIPTSTTDAATVEVVKPPLNEKQPLVEGFREDKYLKNWRPEMSAHRRSIGLDLFNHEVKKHNERTTKQMASIFVLDRDIHSIQTLERAAQLRTGLLQNRLGALRQRIQELDSKGQ